MISLFAGSGSGRVTDEKFTVDESSSDGGSGAVTVEVESRLTMENDVTTPAQPETEHQMPSENPVSSDISTPEREMSASEKQEDFMRRNGFYAYGSKWISAHDLSIVDHPYDSNFILGDWEDAPRELHEEFGRMGDTPGPPPQNEPAQLRAAREVARFVPESGRITVDPSALAIVGQESEFRTDVETTVIEARLLNRDVRVRFEPAHFRWDMGDGRQIPDGRSQIMHAYSESGTRQVRVVPVFRAFVASPGVENWRQLDGMVDGDALTLDVEVRNVRSVLVGHECADTPHAPGCAALRP